MGSGCKACALRMSADTEWPSRKNIRCGLLVLCFPPCLLLPVIHGRRPSLALTPSPMSSCHRALQNCDVVHEIFSWLVPASRYDDMTPEEDAQRKRARHDLLSVALVCRVLAEHALDALWRELDDLLPVMLLLTESHESESEGLNASAALAGTQEPSVSYLSPGIAVEAYSNALP